MRSMLIAAVSIWLAAAGTARAETPENLAFYAYTPNLAQTIGDVAAFTEQLGLPSATVRMLPMIIGSAINNQSLSGVVLDGPWAVVVNPPADGNWDGPPPFAIGFTTRGDNFRKGMASRLGEPVEGEGNYLTFSVVTRIFDTEAYSNASSDAQENYEQFFVESTKPVFVAGGDDYAWYTEDAGMAAGLGGFSLGEIVPLIDSPVVVAIRPATVLALVKNAIGTFDLEELVPTQKMLLDLVDHYVGQMGWINLGLGADKTGVTVQEAIQGRPGSNFDTYIRAQENGPLTLAGYLPRGAYILSDQRVARQDMIMDAFRRFVDTFTSAVLAQTGDDKDAGKAVGVIQKMSSDLLNLYDKHLALVGDEVASAITLDAGGAIGYVVLEKLADPDAFVKFLTGSLGRDVQSLSMLSTMLGIKVEPDFSGVDAPRLCRQFKVYSYRFAVGPAQADEGSPLDLGTIDSPQLKMIFENGINFETAVVGDLGITVMTTAKSTGIDDLIGRVADKRPSWDPAQVIPCYPGANSAGILNYNALFNAFPATEQPEQFQALRNVDLSFPFCSRVENGVIKVWGTVPASTISQAMNAMGFVPSEGGSDTYGD